MCVAVTGALLLLSPCGMPAVVPEVGPATVQVAASAAAAATPAPAAPDPAASQPAAQPAPPPPPPPPPPAAPPAAEPEPAPPPPPPPGRTVVGNPWTPFATAGGVVLHHPASSVERVGFHESNHEGAQQLVVLTSAVNPLTLPTRERATGARSAADVVVNPDTEIRSPVTGTVLRAGTYVLYCRHHDDFAVIEPDGHPGWEVKVLHIRGVRVRRGMRVEAGRTVIASGATPLPFVSQVDDYTAEPSWPHVHIEVVDTSIPNRPSPGGGRGC